MKTLISRMLAIFLVLTMCLSLAAAQAEEPTTLLLMTGSESDPYWQSVFDMIADFNAEYEGKIHIETEFAGAQSADLMEKMKVLNASKALPAIVSRLNEDVGFAQTLAANDRLLDIRPYFEADETWQEYALANNVVSSIEMSGGDALYFTPLTSSCYIGLFYNKEMLAAVGYDEFPSDSWEEFWVMCDKLVEAGYTPFAMDTMDSAWCSMLLCTSIVGETQEGMEWMTGLYPTDFNNDYMRKVMDTFKRIFDNYTTPDANGAPYAVAANNFLSEQAAMIANGPWMINSMMDPSYCAEDFQYKVGYAPFPGNVMIIENDLIGQSAISKDVSEAEQMAAVEWFKFQARPEQIRKECLTRGYNNPKVDLSDDDFAEKGPIYLEYNHAVSKVKTTLSCYQTRWDSVTLYEVLTTELPNLINGTITTEELLTKMSEAATQFVKDQAESVQ